MRQGVPGPTLVFPWSNLVYKHGPNKQLVWEFMRFISNAKDDLEQHQIDGVLPVWAVNLQSDYVKSRPDFQSTQEMLARPAPNYLHPKFLEMLGVFGDAVVGALYQKGQPKALLDQAAVRMDSILKDYELMKK